MAANIADQFSKAKDLFSTTLSSGINDSTGTIPLNSVSGLPTDTVVILTIDAVDSQGNDTPNLREVVKGIVSGSNLTTSTRGVEGTAQAHSSGAVVTMVPTMTHWNRAMDGIIAEHNNVAGTHKFAINYDTNGNEVIEFATTASAVNHIKVIPAASGSNVAISAAGTGSGSNRAIDFYDSNGNELFKGSSTASAVNEFTIANAATGAGPTLSSTGETNVDINITPKGTGKSAITNLQPKGFFRNTVSKTNSDSPYSVAATDTDVLYSTASGASTVTLPTAASVSGRTITVTKTSSDTNLLTIATTSSQTINGGAGDYLLGQYDFVTYMSDGSDWIIVSSRRKPVTATVATSETRTSTSYGDLATAGPSVTLAVGPSGIVDLDYRINMYASGPSIAYAAVDISGANTTAATDANGIFNGSGTNFFFGGKFRITGLTPGSTTFKVQYRVSGGTGTFLNRYLSGEAR